VKAINSLILDIFYYLNISKLFWLYRSVKVCNRQNEPLVKDSLNSLLRQNVYCCLFRWNRFLLVNLSVVKLVKKFSDLYGTRKFIAVSTKSLYFTLSRDRWSSPQRHTLFILRYILISSSYLRLGLPCYFFPPHFLTKIFYTFVTSMTM
jgi:hypothetical protein